MSKERTFRINPFDPYDYWKIGDLERCPYLMCNAQHTTEWIEWNRKDKERMLLIALDRYADYLTTRRHSYPRFKLGPIEEVDGY